MSGSLLTVDRAEFTAAFAKRPLGVRHDLADHPLLTLEAIAELADALPDLAVERHEAKQPLLVPGGAEELTGRPSDTVRSIETNDNWMVLWNLEQSPDYRALLDQILDEAEGYLPKGNATIQREAFLFLSAPNAVTPAHFDPEHNFLLQIRGHKKMVVARYEDPADMVGELHRYYDGGHRNLDKLPDVEATFEMDPGDGVYVYPMGPHWVENGPAASISLSITFRTRRSKRDEQAQMLNARMRRAGLKPRPVGRAPAVDALKGGLMGAAQGIRSIGRSDSGISRSG